MSSNERQRVALVTGGTGFLGQEVVRRLLDRGMRVHVSWVEPEEVERLRRFLGQDADRVHLQRCDLTDAAAVEELVHGIDGADGGLDVLANIAGGFAYAPLAETDADLWRRMLEMNATSCFLCSRAVVGPMARGGWGRIVNVAAMPALERGAPGMSAYSAAKAAVLNLTQSLAAELLGAGITVNAILPTLIDTPANRAAMPDADTSGWLPPAEIAGVVEFLASDAARLVTGSAVTLALG